VALTAERDKVFLNVLVSESFVCLVVDLKPPLRAVVQARLALTAVNAKTLVPLFGPMRTGDVVFVETAHCPCLSSSQSAACNSHIATERSESGFSE
jgi:hypothetical protein